MVVLALAAGCGRFNFDTHSDDARATTIDATPSDPYSSAVLADQPIGYWRLGETVGLIAHDEVGTHDGTYDPACGLGVPGLAGTDTAVAFDGSACRVTIGDAFAFSGVPKFTIELWARIDRVDNEVRRLVSRNRAPNSTGYQIAFFQSTLWFEQFTAAGGADYIATDVPAEGTPFHLAVAIDANQQELFIDGMSVATTTSSPVTSPDTGTVMFGDLAPETYFKYVGVLDEVAVYDHVLSADRIAAHFNAR